MAAAGQHHRRSRRFRQALWPGATSQSVLQFLTFDRENPNSIISCLRAARENARSVREIISSEMWLQLNTFYLMVNSAASNGKGFESRTIFSPKSSWPAIFSPASPMRP